jgi:antitoxin (DNA-binding transcriptional repressor) of toxin-antitoxin stability system
MTKDDKTPAQTGGPRFKETDDDFWVQLPDPALGRLGDWTPPSLHLDWDPVPDLIAERDRYRYCGGVTMTKDITVQELQEHFADHMEEVRRGVTLRLIDGGNPVAKISPDETKPGETKPGEIPEDMIYRRARGSFADFVQPPPIESNVDIVDFLLEDRDTR